MRKIKRSSRYLLALMLVMLLAFGTMITAFSATTLPDCTGPKVLPTEIDGNPSFPSVSPPCYTFKIDPPVSGSRTYGGVTIYFEVYNDGKMLKFWTENDIPIVQKVHVKGGPAANLYDYTSSPVNNDCNLVSPTMENENVPGISHFEFYLCVPQTGCLEVKKSWEPGDSGATYADPVSVEIRDAAGNLVRTLELTSTNSWTATACGLLPGDYYFEEISVTGWSPSYDPIDRKLVVVAGDTAAASAKGTVTNTYIDEYGCLEITKIWDYEGVEGFDEETMLPSEIVVVVTGPSYPSGKEFTLEADKDWYLEICNLIPGGYTVEEKAGQDWLGKWVIEVVYDGDEDNTYANVVADETATAEITNTFKTGCLEIEKFWEYNYEDENIMLPSEIVVIVTGPSYPSGKEFTLEADEDWYLKICALIPGNYTVEEKAGKNWLGNWVVEVVYDGDEDNTYANVVADETATAEITNTFTDDPKGSISGTKFRYDTTQGLGGWTINLFMGSTPPGDPNNDTPFKTTVTDSTGNYEFTNLSPGKYWVYEVLKSGWTQMCPQQGYHEVDIPLVPMILSGFDNGLPEPVYNYNIEDVDFCNREDQQEPKGSLTIRKVITNPASGDLDRSFEASVVGPGGYNQTVTFSQNAPATLTGLAFGDYTVTEINIPSPFILVSGSPTTVTLSSASVEARSASVTITNRRPGGDDPPPSFGNIVVEKVVLADDVDTDVTFTVNVARAAIGFNRNVSVKAGQSETLSGLFLGEYTISEVSIPAGYKLVSISPQVVNLTANGQTVRVVITNEKEEEFPPPPPFIREEEPEQQIVVTPPPPELPRTGGYEMLLMGMGGLLAGAGAYLKLRSRKKRR